MKGRTLLIGVLVFIWATGCAQLNLKQKVIALNEVKEVPERAPVYHYEGWIVARAVLHNHTTYSDGCRTPEDLVQLARNKGVAILSITDHREGQMCIAGTKLCYDVGGVDSPKKGYQAYYEHINRLAKESQSPIILFGLETMPYLWIERRYGTILGSGANNHFTSYGIEDPEIYAQMPARKILDFKVEKNPGPEPYIKWVDYIRENGGEVFFAHPDIADDSWRLTLHHKAGPPYYLLPYLLRLTGVALVPDAMVETAKPGGVWDEALFNIWWVFVRNRSGLGESLTIIAIPLRWIMASPSFT